MLRMGFGSACQLMITCGPPNCHGVRVYAGCHTSEKRMRMIPVKTGPPFRRVWIKLLMWEIAVRMREQHGNPDVWLLASPEPTGGSPWGQTRAYGSSFVELGSLTVVDVAEVEARTRLNAVHDYFGGLRTAMSNRRVYSLYALCRSTIEACAFATWIYDPAAHPAAQLVRALLLAEQSLGMRIRSFRELQQNPYGELNSDGLTELAEAISQAEDHRCDIKKAIMEICTADEPVRKLSLQRSLRVPSKTHRIREMLCDEMGLPQASDAYYRMSGVAHSETTAILDTWNVNEDKPSIDYFSFLQFLHLAVCSIDFSLERRAKCWGQSYKSAGLHKIIRRLEHILAGEPNVHLMSPPS